MSAGWMSAGWMTDAVHRLSLSNAAGAGSGCCDAGKPLWWSESQWHSLPVPRVYRRRLFLPVQNMLAWQEVGWGMFFHIFSLCLTSEHFLGHQTDF